MRSNWWLRDVASGANFANVNNNGNANNNNASNTNGVRPDFASPDKTSYEKRGDTRKERLSLEQS